MSGETYSEFNSEIFQIVNNYTLELNEIIPNHVLSGMTDIYIYNLNKIPSNDIEKMNEHYIGDFIYFSGSTLPINIIAKENEKDYYIDYDMFKITSGSSDYYFYTDNTYIKYNLFNHLNSINPTIFNLSFDFGSGYTLSSFTQESTYLLDDPSYPQQTSDMYSMLKITPNDVNDLKYFYKNTYVYIDGSVSNNVLIIDKDDTSFTIERPITLSPGSNISMISSLYTLKYISDILYLVYINNTQYHISDNIKNKIFSSYNNIISNNNKIIKNTTGTITSLSDEKYILKLFNYRNILNTLITGNTIDGIFYKNDKSLLLESDEILEIGIDGLTKYPSILEKDDIIITDKLGNYKIDIINNKNYNNVVFIDGVSIETIRIRYNWLLNAKIKNAIIGEDSYGLVWYMGEWICGEWVDGTWYSGTWYSGVWKNGNWYSYNINKNSLLYDNSIMNRIDDKNYSKFLNGKWMNGKWYNGIFGDDIVISGYTSKPFLSHIDILPDDMDISIWYDGIFYGGEFKNSIWEKGLFKDGIMYGGYWKNGIFNNGIFSGNWWDGIFYGGDFVYGIWENGTFSSTLNISRFGYNNIQLSGTVTEWWDGKMIGAEIFSGNDEFSNNNKTHLYKGELINSKWYGGHFFTGEFINSYFYDGVFGTYENDVINYNSGMTFQNSDFYNGLWLDGKFIDSKFFGGIWLDGELINSDIRTKNYLIDKSIKQLEI
jgi:hypothetical protein